MFADANLLIALTITLAAGLSTVLGGLIALYTKQTNKKFLAAALAFAAGVMIYVSLIELFPEARQALSPLYGERKGYWVTTLAFFAGIALTALLDLLLPETDSASALKESDGPAPSDPALLRVGLFSALALAIHNFPEGLVTFASTIHDPQLGLSIALAIAIHNIPEGIAIAAPVYFATGNRQKALLYSLLAGLAEPAGALVGYFLLHRFLDGALLGLIFAGVAGIMIYISFAELLPAAAQYDEGQAVIWGLFSGMAVMALSLLLFA